MGCFDTVEIVDSPRHVVENLLDFPVYDVNCTDASVDACQESFVDICDVSCS